MTKDHGHAVFEVHADRLGYEIEHELRDVLSATCQLCSWREAKLAGTFLHAPASGSLGVPTSPERRGSW